MNFDWIALLALLLSGYAVYVAAKSARSTEQLTLREIEWVRIQLDRAKQGAKAEKIAEVSARLFKEGKGWKVKVYNKGPMNAENVRLMLDKNNSIVGSNAVDRFFPMERMEKGQSVEFSAFVHMQSPSKERLTLRWNDPSGVDRENSVELTV